jgi:hypothetical protein
MAARLPWRIVQSTGVNLDEVLDREWIHRSWTFQEFVLAGNLIVVCGTKKISWDDLASALCSQPCGSGARREAPLPASEVVLSHWRTIIALWFNLPRIRLSRDVRKEGILVQDLSFRQRLITFWVNGKLPRELPRLYNVVAVLLHLFVWPLWGFTSYKIIVAGRKAINRKDRKGGDRFMPWYCFLFAWLIAFYMVYSWTYRIQQRWHFTIYGWKQEWLLQDHMASEDYRVLDAIRAALRERKSTDSRDKAYALHGVLAAHGATPSRPDYSHSIGKTYQNLVQDLVSLNPAAIAIVMDASSRGPFDGPSWVPNWQLSVPSTWLTSKYVLGVTETCTPFYSKPNFSILGPQLHLKGRSKGTLTFKASIIHPNCTNEDDCLKAVCLALLRFWTYTHKGLLKAEPNDKVISALFAILHGQSPKRGPTGVWHEGTSGPDGSPGYWEKYPTIRGPYDFRPQSSEFESWSVLYKMLEPRIASLSFVASEDLETLLDFRWQTTLLPSIKGSKVAKQFLIRVHNRIGRQRRCFFVLGKEYIGTGPYDLNSGDEVFLLGGVPVPMALRAPPRLQNAKRERQEDGKREGEGENRGREEERGEHEADRKFKVVGAVMVHGLMHAEKFREGQMGNVVLV